jgi:3-oxoacid CoA-transferase subunit B
MEHCNKEGQSKVLRACTLPLTGKRVVHRIISDLAVMDVTSDGLRLLEVAPGVSAREIQDKTEARLVVGPDLQEMRFA